MLRSDQKKLEEFRDRVSSFKNDALTAPEMIESFFSLFDSTSAELGKLIKELADIFEIASKRDGLLKAWNDWKAINEDYPSLPGSTPTSNTVAGGSHGRNRVLKLKSSTAQSSRSSVNRTASWGTTPTAGIFPSLSKRPAASSSSSSKRTSRPTTTPWVGASATPSPLTSQPTSRSSSHRGARAPGATLSDSSAFPSLPPAPKPTSTLFTPGHTGYGVRRINGLHTGADGTNKVNAWAGRDDGSTMTAASAEADVGAVGEAEEAPIGGRRKGNKNKKQTLMHFG
jgi:hypothetical protein